MTDVKKVIALNRLRAQMLDEEVSPAQKQYYLELAQWLENQNIQTAEEATESIKNTPYYDGAALAKELDGIHLRIRAAVAVLSDNRIPAADPPPKRHCSHCFC